MTHGLVLVHSPGVGDRNTMGYITESSSPCPHSTCICTFTPAPLKQPQRQSGWQLPLFKGALMARRCLLPLGRGDWLWLLATEDQPAAARIHSAKNHRLFQAGRKRFAFVNSQSQAWLSHPSPVCVGAPGRWSFHLHRSATSGKRCLQPLLTVRCLSGTVIPVELSYN